jgi:PAS domain S-box-containing protein
VSWGRRRGRLPEAPPELSSALLESLADPVLACDAEGTIVTYNRRAREVLGAGERVPAEEWADHCPIYRRDGSQVMRPEELPLAHALRGEEVRDVQLEVRPNGRRHVMNVSGNAVRGPDGVIQGAVIVMRDITERVALEERLCLEGAIAANVAEGIALVRADDGEILYVNEKWDRMFGYEDGELVGRHISLVNAPVDQPPEERAREMMEALERDGVWSGEVHNLRKDGTDFWCATNVSTLEHPRHGTVWIAVHTDITDRKAGEDALRQAEERFRQVFEEGPVGMLLVDNDLRIADANQSFCELTGYGHHELVGTLCTAISHTDDAEREADLGARLAAGRIPRYRIEKRFVTKQGDVVRVAQTTTAVHGADGEPLYRVAMVEPLGER